ncbi:hypothetical protein A2524_02525 [Candidatus Wolfebacteria bacterium RIFOXYD12_FULL_48_21]|uniref:SurA N-terminal domain-containing protein n=1 Tax=Candidatus Wolfebacteria bacterium RIFOXYD1_FULL_48_65 TaxID=1802561 RepID=A0A1F8DYX1_9BACT|nr:MAG: hypothetical protein A2610_01195 [Candidatus Wolfebacteria bacterium RIFOXYD1_FULL_48_65]OGM94743.1 MAG: hypothetical protein A2524_02525 [Candidatus Wolfebacteria bacterium RIFOXYD12_FULL_48_21]OGM95814.1 MAG: hypothetical protein A2532_00395 [Candidatus Wolfebacteria bacterium RIFOXYD2_FULL_48_11]
MKPKKIVKLTALIGGGIILIGGIVIGVTGLWPVARVGASPITYAAFRDNFMMVDYFYRSNVRITGGSDQAVNTNEVQRDLQRVTMEGLIDRILIDRELKKRYTDDDLERLIANKIEGVDLTSETMVEAMRLMYGLEAEGFKELVLIPKAKQEILEGNLSLQNGTFSDWLAAQKTEASILVFVPSLQWSGDEVRVR